MNVTGGAGEGEEAQQRASLCSSATDFSLGIWGGGSRDNVSKLRGVWVCDGVARGEEARDRMLEGIQGGEGVGFGREEVVRDCRHLSSR